MQECGWLTVDILTIMTQWNTVSWGQTGPGRELRSLNSPSRASYSKAVVGTESRSQRPELQNTAPRKAKPVSERQQDRQLFPLSQFCNCRTGKVKSTKSIHIYTGVADPPLYICQGLFPLLLRTTIVS